MANLAVKFTLLLAVILSLTACSSTDISHHAGRQPALQLEQFFDGPLTAHGVVKNWRGEVIRSFNADIKAYWRDGVGTLEEDFVFDDGEEQRRVWTLTPDGEDSEGHKRYIGTAGDVVGDSEAQLAGNALFMEYVLRLPYNDSTLDVTIDDRMYLVSPTVIVNESTMKKFGLTVGKILLVIERRPQ